MNHEDLDAEFERIVSGWDIDAEEPTPRAASTRPEPDPAPTPPPGDIQADFATEGATDSQTDTATDHPTDPEAGHAADDTSDGPDGAVPPLNPGDGTGRHDASPPTVGSKAPSINPPPVFRGGLTLPVAPTTSHVWRGSAAADAPPSGPEPVLDDDHFVPEDPDLPSAEDDPMFWAIVAGLVGGPLLLLYVLLFDQDGSPWWIVTALTMIVVGFVMLVLRGSDERDPFDDGSRV